MLFKCVALLIVKPEPRSPLPWGTYKAYVILLAAAVVGAGNITAMNKGLRRGEAVIVVPIYYSLGMLMQILTGSVYFHELRGFSGLDETALFWGGCVMLILCIVALTRSRICEEEQAMMVRSTSRTQLKPEASLACLESRGAEPQPKLQAWSSTGSLRRPLRSGEDWMAHSISRSGSFDPEAYPESFGENPRLYSVSVMGPLGIA